MIELALAAIEGQTPKLSVTLRQLDSAQARYESNRHAGVVAMIQRLPDWVQKFSTINPTGFSDIKYDKLPEDATGTQRFYRVMLVCPHLHTLFPKTFHHIFWLDRPALHDRWSHSWRLMNPLKEACMELAIKFCR